MKATTSIRIPTLLLCILGGLAVTCTSPNSQEGQTTRNQQLGELKLEVTAGQQARSHFENGLLLLHSFEYFDAASEFVEAQILEPDFVMAYWGEAMTYNHPLWRYQNHDKGVAILNKLGRTSEERLSKAGTELEKDFLRSVEVLYGEGDKEERDQKYTSFMAELYEKYPENHEVAAFYALSLLGSVAVGRDEETYGRGAIVAQGILNENPNHPGALHYMIHSYDDPQHAFKALNAANNYAVVAKDASHALHMPSHIYVALGMWDHVVRSNIDSWEASIDRMQRKDLDNDAQSYHALHWLMYGYLQLGDVDKASSIMADMIRFTDELPSRRARDYLVSMKGTYLAETDDWGGNYRHIAVKTEDLNVSTQGIMWLTEAFGAFIDQDVTMLRSVVAAMTSKRQAAEAMVLEQGIATCTSVGQRGQAPNQLDVDQLYIMELEVSALLAISENDPVKAHEALKKATLHEESISYSYGPPPIAKPSSELYAEFLMNKANYGEALRQFDKSLQRGPKRTRSMRGKAMALRALNRIAEADSLIQEIEAIQGTKLNINSDYYLNSLTHLIRN